MNAEEAKNVLRAMESDHEPDSQARVALALQVLMEELAANASPTPRGAEWTSIEHSVWVVFERIRECLLERKDFRGIGVLLDTVASQCLNTRLGRGRQLGVLLLGEYGDDYYTDTLERLLDDEEVYGHALDSLTRGTSRGKRERVAQILKNEAVGWIRRSAKKYLSPVVRKDAKR